MKLFSPDVLIVARSPPRFWQVLQASLHFRVGMLIMRKHDFSRITQPSGQAGLVTENQVKLKLKFTNLNADEYLWWGRDLSLSQTYRNRAAYGLNLEF